MRYSIFFMLTMLLFTSSLMLIIQGCAATASITSNKGTIKLGMTKAEVLVTWGEPDDKGFLEDEDKLGRYELWYYPYPSWVGGHKVEISFNKKGIVVYVEALYK